MLVLQIITGLTQFGRECIVSIGSSFLSLGAHEKKFENVFRGKTIMELFLVIKG